VKRTSRRNLRMNKPPSVVVLAGPNGAGKSTTAPTLLKGALGVTEFVDADTIARGLSAFQPERVALSAGRIMLRRLKELASQRVSFAYETTLASRMFARWLVELRQSGYRVHLLFLWLPSADLAVERVADRVHMGGHDVPEGTVRRRYAAGLRNFFSLYQPLANTWRIYDNSKSSGPRLIARGRSSKVTGVLDDTLWARITSEVECEADEEQGG
jgi:predicted ABC-type ATPase